VRGARGGSAWGERQAVSGGASWFRGSRVHARTSHRCSWPGLRGANYLRARKRALRLAHAPRVRTGYELAALRHRPGQERAGAAQNRPRRTPPAARSDVLLTVCHPGLDPGSMCPGQLDILIAGQARNDRALTAKRVRPRRRPVIGVGRAQRPIRAALVPRSGAAVFTCAAHACARPYPREKRRTIHPGRRPAHGARPMVSPLRNQAEATTR
jgi:hypothetical protein